MQNNISEIKNDMSATQSEKLTGHDVAKYKEKTYAIAYMNEGIQSYFLVPVKNPDVELGFWVKMDRCQVLYN